MSIVRSSCLANTAITCVQVQSGLLAAYNEYSAVAAVIDAALVPVNIGSIELQLERQLRRFRRLGPSGHPGIKGWAAAFERWKQSVHASDAGLHGFSEAPPTVLMREAALGNLSPGPNILDNLCAAVMLASSCAVSVVDLQAFGCSRSDPSLCRAVTIPAPWEQSLRSRRVSAATPSLCAPSMICVSGVRGCDFSLAQALLDVLLRPSTRGVSRVCWSERMTDRAPSSTVRWPATGHEAPWSLTRFRRDRFCATPPVCVQ